MLSENTGFLVSGLPLLCDVQNSLRVFVCNQEECSGCSGRAATTLFPILKRSNGNADKISKLALRKTGLLAYLSDIGHRDNSTAVTLLELPNSFEHFDADVAFRVTHSRAPCGSGAAYGQGSCPGRSWDKLSASRRRPDSVSQSIWPYSRHVFRRSPTSTAISERHPNQESHHPPQDWLSERPATWRTPDLRGIPESVA